MGGVDGFLGGRSLPNPVRWVAIPLAALSLTLFFAFWTFPFERLAGRLGDLSENAAGVRLEASSLQRTLGLTGPGIEGTAVRATLARGESVMLPRVFFRPAFSLNWFRAVPTLRVEVEGGGLGNLDGTLRLGSAPGYEGDFTGVNAALLPLENVVAGLSATGLIDGSSSVAAGPDGAPTGTLVFSGSDGTIGVPGLPVSVPFRSLDAEIHFGGEQYASVERFELDGPLLAATLSGSVGRSETPGAEPLDLTIDMTVRARGTRRTLSDVGIAVNGSRAMLRIRGTRAQPQF